MRAVAFLALLLLAGCEHVPAVADRVATGPVPVTCAAQCTATCLPSVWPEWTGDPANPATWDNVFPDVVGPHQEIARRCDAARQACLACITRVERAGVLCGVTMPCEVQP